MDKDFDLEALFAQAAETRVDPSTDLFSRILADADKAQPKPQPLVLPVISAQPQGGVFGWVVAFADVLGGGRALAGLSLAGATGLFFGMAQPNVMQSVTALLSGETATVEQIDLLPATGTLWTEN